MTHNLNCLTLTDREKLDPSAICRFTAALDGLQMLQVRWDEGGEMDFTFKRNQHDGEKGEGLIHQDYRILNY